MVWRNGVELLSEWIKNKELGYENGKVKVPRYNIPYVFSGYGVEAGYVVLGIEKII